MLSGLFHRYAAAALAAVVLTATGCTDDDPEAGPSPTDTASVEILQPGAPGEPNTTVSTDDVQLDDPWNHDDVAFTQMMIPHHGQALDMAALAPARAADPRVKRLASRIAAAQRPEILWMSSWLQERDLEVPKKHEPPADYDHGQHGHNRMHGMLTDAQMRELRAAIGARFDRLFLTGMIQHHQGALLMASNVSKSGQDINVSALAADVNATQTAEINRMRGLLKSL